MRDLPRLPEGASCDEKIRIIYDWLYELQMEISSIGIFRDSSSSTQNDSEKSLSQNDESAVQMAAEGVMADADVTSGEEQFEEI